MRWSLDELYSSFEAEEYQEDLISLEKRIIELKEWSAGLSDQQTIVLQLEEFINQLQRIHKLFDSLLSYSYLTLSVDAKNQQALQMVELLEGMQTELTKPYVNFKEWLHQLDGLEEYVIESELLQEHKFFLLTLFKEGQYLLSKEEEITIAKMQQTGSKSWEKLYELLSSTLSVELELDGEEKKLALAVVRNMAYSKDLEKRKKAYHAELKAYQKVDDSIAAALNGIKGEVITLTEMRGYDSPLARTLLESKMDQSTLDAMLIAIKEYLPEFQKYYLKKAEMLGHKEGLPFYDLFAPVGEADFNFSYKDARDFIIDNFNSFSNKLANFADRAFKENWIDAEPRPGKRGGAFCSNIHSIGQSRILANFSGNLGEVITLAHELGHGYHGDCLKEESILNSNYPMPLAETASTFCETIVNDAVLNSVTKEDSLTILEKSIADAGQVIVDIYSRYLFETKLFELRAESSLSVDKLKELMVEAQKQAYGAGLDPNYLHPYMWLCKPHYYFSDSNFYNFPYAFGLLFAKGLYAKYLDQGDDFIAAYDQLLSITAKHKISDVAQTIGIDVNSVDFWRSSLELIKKDIAKFLQY